MKTALKTAILIVALATMTACSAQRRAEKHMRKAVALCPTLVQTKARSIDAVLTAPGFADVAVLPLSDLMRGDTLYAATDHGTVVVSQCRSDSTLRAGFVAAPREIHYQDTVHYAQVVVEATRPKPKDTAGRHLGWVVLGMCAGMGICLYLFAKSN